MKFVFIGQSLALMAAARLIGEREPSAEMVLISCDGRKPYDRACLSLYLSKKIKESELFSEAEDFARSYDIKILLDREITRVNCARRRVFLSDRQSQEYDVLIIADCPQIKLPAVKGLRRTGVFNMARLESVKGLLRFLPFLETALVQCDSIRGVETALTLREMGKDVLLVSAASRLPVSNMSAAQVELLAALLERRGIRTLLGNSVEDILGEAEVKAVRLRSGKVVACEAVIFADPEPDMRFWQDSGLVIDQRVPVVGNMRTNLENVFAVEAVCQMESPKILGGYSLSRAEAISQGEVAARAALGESVVYERIMEERQSWFEKNFSSEEMAEPVPATAAESAGDDSPAVVPCATGGPDPAGGSGG